LATEPFRLDDGAMARAAAGTEAATEYGSSGPEDADVDARMRKDSDRSTVRRRRWAQARPGPPLPETRRGRVPKREEDADPPLYLAARVGKRSPTRNAEPDAAAAAATADVANGGGGPEWGADFRIAPVCYWSVQRASSATAAAFLGPWALAPSAGSGLERGGPGGCPVEVKAEPASEDWADSEDTDEAVGLEEKAAWGIWPGGDEALLGACGVADHDHTMIWDADLSVAAA
jgi:hypothetical protein